MKTLLVSFALLLISAGAQAAPVLIDFEDVTPQFVSPGVLLDIETKGFRFDASTYFASPPEASAGPGGLWSSAECFAWGPECGAYISMEAISGGPFAILSIGSSDGDFFGTLAGGGTADLSGAIGTGDWLNLEYFQVSNICEGPFGCGYFEASLDDITVNVVPIPAAAWLFGSALAGLGWMRRRKSA